LKKIIFILASGLFLIGSQAWAVEAVTIEGTIQGLNCITTGKICPLDKNDPWAASEDIFALYTKGSDYYLVSNMDRAALKSHTNEIVRITGEVHPVYKSMQASKFEVQKKGVWAKTWPLFPGDFTTGRAGLPNFH